MYYSDGSVYEGQWTLGKRHGKGTLSKSGLLLEGNWIDDVQIGQGKLIFSRKDPVDIFTGDIANEKANGHGVRETGKTAYVGSFKNGLKHGYGVEDSENGEKYLGMWAQDQRRGHGCVVHERGIYYLGLFNDTNRVRNGTLLLQDGSRYEGDFTNSGQFNGDGELYLGPRKFKGKFNGNCYDRMSFQGEIIFNKHRDSANGNGTEILKEILDADDKWKELFDNWTKAYEGDDNQRIWVKIANSQVRSDSLTRIPSAGQEAGSLNIQDYVTIKKYLYDAFNTEEHPLYILLSQLVDAFKKSYGKVKDNNADSHLIPLAVKVCSQSKDFFNGG